MNIELTRFYRRVLETPATHYPPIADLKSLYAPFFEAGLPEPKTAEIRTLKPKPAFKAVPEPAPAPPPSLYDRLKTGLSKTRGQLGDKITELLAGRKSLDQSLLEELETQLLVSDVGYEATDRIINRLSQRRERQENTLVLALEEEMRHILDLGIENPLTQPKLPHQPFVILVVGVNGVGKTTTIGKLAWQLSQEGHKLLLAAGDTFRAAATEQLQAWGQRVNVPVIAQQPGADSASVIFDALSAAKARGVDIVIADTAGRLHNKAHLMNELEKIKRVLKKQDEQAPHMVLLVLDASAGQNALNQAREFHQILELSGIVLTKLDGTAKGGIIFAICEQLKLPVWYIGVGEKTEDLRAFEPEAFVNALIKT